MMKYSLNINHSDHLYSIRFPKSVLFLTIILLLLLALPYPSPKPTSAAGEALTISAPTTLSGTYGITATRFSDKANPAFYFEPSGTSVLNNITGNLSGNATTATTATNQSGGTVNATTGAFSGNVTFPGTGIWNSSGNVGIGTTGPGAKLNLVNNNFTSTYGSIIEGYKSTYSADSGVLYVKGNWEYNTSRKTDPILKVAAYNDPAGFYILHSGNVGIGTTGPGAKLHVVYDGTNNYSTFDGGNTLLKSNSNSATILTVTGTGTGDLLNVMDNTTEVFTILDGGKVGIGTTGPNYKLEVAGVVYASGSSRDYKQDIKNLEVDSSKIYDLQPVSYDYKKEYKNLGYTLAGGRQFGLIAEDTYKVIPELVISKNDKKTANIDYEKLSVLLLAELKKLKNTVDQQQKQINQLQIIIGITKP